MADQVEMDFDIEGAVQAIGEDLFDVPVEEENAEGQEETPDGDEEVSRGTEEIIEEADTDDRGETEETGETEEVTESLAVPDSWPKEMRDHWQGVPREVQEYWQTREQQWYDGLEQYKENYGYGKQLRETLNPYKPIMQAAGLDDATAVQYLMNAHYKLTQGPIEQRRSAYEQLGKELGIATTVPGDAPLVDPNVKSLQDRLTNMETALTQRQQQALTEAREKALKEVETFASDPKHPYFDEVNPELMVFINQGYGLEEAYQKAVRANDVTYQKEIARLQNEHAQSLKEKARTNGEMKRKAVSANVRSRESAKGPTEPEGSMEDTLRSTLAEIRSRGA